MEWFWFVEKSRQEIIADTIVANNEWIVWYEGA